MPGKGFALRVFPGGMGLFTQFHGMGHAVLQILDPAVMRRVRGQEFQPAACPRWPCSC